MTLLNILIVLCIIYVLFKIIREFHEYLVHIVFSIFILFICLILLINLKTLLLFISKIFLYIPFKLGLITFKTNIFIGIFIMIMTIIFWGNIYYKQRF